MVPLWGHCGVTVVGDPHTMGPLWGHCGGAQVWKRGAGQLPRPTCFMAVVEPDKMLVSSFPNEGLRSIALDVEVEQFNYYSFTQLYNTIKIV